MLNKVILFDGVCNLCNGFVQFIIKRDAEGIFRFASLQSAFAQNILLSFNLDPVELKTVIFIEDGKLYTKSDAALRIAKNLKGGWKLAYALILIPKFIRNGTYNFISKNRYKWFGKKDQCMIPSPELKERFLR